MAAETGKDMLAAWSEYLDEFRGEVEAQLTGGPDEGALSLKALSFYEDDDGVWAVAVVDSLWVDGPFEHRRLAIPASGPDKDGWLAGTIFATCLVEDFDTGRAPP
ncbi:hypothetical protein [Streptomyces sp. NPDC046821]|uniref:hypothetical protein n=1 Tax=Streptomyces sp. NPDC046821 TaxID=3154702 RepID=UPI0033ED3291